MSIEIEKKFCLTTTQRNRLPERLREIGANPRGAEFEENTLYRGAALAVGSRILRLRRVGGRAILTLKERLPSAAPIKHQREDETEIKDADAMHAILVGLGFMPVLVYEKRRETWLLGSVEIVLDELPFGLFMEIEGNEDEINDIEQRLGIEAIEPENLTYPQLAMEYGTPNGEVTEVRFATSDK